MKILQLAPRFPFPPDDGGKIGMANIIKEFSNQGAEVTLFTFSEPGSVIKESAIDEAKKYCRPVFMEHSTQNTLSRIIKSFLRRDSIYIEKHFNDEIKNKLEALVEQENFDIIHADHSCMAKAALYLKNKYNIPVGIRLHNIEYTIWQRFADEMGTFNPQKIFIKQQAELLKRKEAEYFSEADVCFAITGPDKERALEISPNANIVIASAGVNSEEWKPESIKRNPYKLILATTYVWRHNVNAVKWFVEEVLPKVRKKNPEITLSLIGSKAPEWLKEYEGVNVLGYVDKVQPYINKAGIYIAPLFVGGGIRIKILEAMSMAIPVVASPVAAEGITAGEEDGLIVRETANDFAAAITDLSENYAKAEEYGKKAREYVIQNYSWHQNVGIMINEYRNLFSI